MYVLWQALIDYTRQTWRRFFSGWNHFWFAPQDPTTLAVVRILTGCILFYIHATCVFRVLDFIGPQGWVDAQAMTTLRSAHLLYPEPQVQELNHAYTLSIFFWI